MTFDSNVSVTVQRITGSTATINNVQSLICSLGRANIDQFYRAGRMTVSGRVPGSLPTLAIGDTVRVTIQAIDAGVPDQALNWSLRLIDLTIDYGIVSSQDTWTMTLEDAFGLLGRATVSLSVTAGTTTTAAANAVANQVPALSFGAFGAATTTTVNAQTFTNANALDLFQTYANTEWAWLAASGNGIKWFTRNAWTGSSQLSYFSDDGTGDLVYDRLIFNGLAETNATKVVVSVRGGTESTAGTGDIGLTLDAYSQTSALAQDLADYIKTVFSSDTAQPFQLSYLLNKQDPDKMLGPIDPEYPHQVEIVFRGSTYTAFVIGWSGSFLPGQYRVTLNLMPQQAIEFLVLDDPVFGKLDSNKLGF